MYRIWVAIILINPVLGAKLNPAVPYITNHQAQLLNKSIVMQPPSIEQTSAVIKTPSFSPQKILSGGLGLLKNKFLDMILLTASLMNAKDEFIAGINFSFPTSPVMLMGNAVGVLKFCVNIIL